MIRLFVNRYRNPDASLVLSKVSMIVQEFPSIVVGNKVKYAVYLVDGKGAYDADSGNNTFTLKMSIGVPGVGTVLQTQNTWTSANETIDGETASGWQAQVDYSVAGVSNYVTGVPSKDAHWEFQFTAGTEIVTVLQQKVKVLNKLIV